MGAVTQYMCLDCDFTIKDCELEYFIDEETECVVKHSTGMLTFNMGRDSKISGRIIPAFCPDCLEEVHFCCCENESDSDELKAALRSDENEFAEILDEKYVFRKRDSLAKGFAGCDDDYGVCPKCGRMIALIREDTHECPKCGGMLFGFLMALYD